MKVFISWSGDTSKAIAEILRGWLPSVIQAVRPYFSPDDITKGARWSTEIAKELEECKIGLICLTADNLEAPWVMFEAGALSKSLSVGRVCPLLFGIEPSDIKGPLVQFQAASFKKDEMKRAIRMMNTELGAAALDTDVLDAVIEKWWPDLDEKIKTVLSSTRTERHSDRRSDRDILEEILARIRAVPMRFSADYISPEVVSDLLRKFEKLKWELRHLVSEDEDIRKVIEGLQRPINYLSDKVVSVDGHAVFDTARGRESPAGELRRPELAENNAKEKDII